MEEEKKKTKKKIDRKKIYSIGGFVICLAILVPLAVFAFTSRTYESGHIEIKITEINESKEIVSDITTVYFPVDEKYLVNPDYLYSFNDKGKMLNSKLRQLTKNDDNSYTLLNIDELVNKIAQTAKNKYFIEGKSYCFAFDFLSTNKEYKNREQTILDLVKEALNKETIQYEFTYNQEDLVSENEYQQVIIGLHKVLFHDEGSEVIDGYECDIDNLKGLNKTHLKNLTYTLINSYNDLGNSTGLNSFHNDLKIIHNIYETRRNKIYPELEAKKTKLHIEKEINLPLGKWYGEDYSNVTYNETFLNYYDDTEVDAYIAEDTEEAFNGLYTYLYNTEAWFSKAISISKDTSKFDDGKSYSWSEKYWPDVHNNWDIYYANEFDKL